MTAHRGLYDEVLLSALAAVALLAGCSRADEPRVVATDPPSRAMPAEPPSAPAPVAALVAPAVGVTPPLPRREVVAAPADAAYAAGETQNGGHLIVKGLNLDQSLPTQPVYGPTGAKPGAEAQPMGH